MAKQKQFEKIIDILRAHDGAVTKEYILKSLEGEIVANRLSTYFWEIRSKANLDVEVVKDGRKVVGYRLAAVSAPAPDGSAPAIPADAQPVASEADAVAVNRAYYDGSQDEDEEN